MELEVTKTFPTFLGQLHVPHAEAIHQDPRAFILAEEAHYLSSGRSNIGGWHSRPDFLNRPEAAVEALTTWVTWVVTRFKHVLHGLARFESRDQ